MIPVCPGHLAVVVTCGHHGIVEDDNGEATQLMLEALFDIKAAVNDIHRALLGGDDEEEEAEEDS